MIFSKINRHSSHLRSQSQLDNLIQTQSLSKAAQQDYRLVQSVIAGDQKAYSSLLMRHRRSVYLQMLKRAKNRADAADLTIEAFGKAFRHLSSYAPQSAFNTWLVRIAINNCIDHKRKKRIACQSLEATLERNSHQGTNLTFIAKSKNPEEEIIQKQKQNQIQELLNKVNAPYRKALQLRFFDELSYDEIALEMNIPMGTVKTYIFRGKKALENMMTGKEMGF